MTYKKAKPLPEECACCKREDCYNCDVAGKRWITPKRKRVARRVEEIDGLLAALGKE